MATSAMIAMVLFLSSLITSSISRNNAHGTPSSLIGADMSEPLSLTQKPPIDPLDPSTYNGDVLNVTKCWCQDPTDSERKGYYFLFDYYNWHEDTVYRANRTCNSRTNNHIRRLPWQPWCWTLWGWHPWDWTCGFQLRPHAYHAPQKNQFCFRLTADRRENNENWTYNPVYSFNDQLRTLEKARSWFDLDSSICQELCPKEIPGMLMAEDAKGSRAITVTGPKDYYVLTSAVTSYTDLDDTCHGCK